MEDIHEHLIYDPNSGSVYWKFNLDKPSHWNIRYAGQRAGCIDKNGYRRLRLNNKLYLEHRIIWFLQMGLWPTNEQIILTEIEQIIWVNLREASRSQNNANSKRCLL